jgi:uncharacterized membrane-anchored protein YjiN (DUF445 family)
MSAEGRLSKAAAEAGRAVVQSGALDAAILSLTRDIRERLDTALAEDTDALVEPLADLIRNAGRSMLSDAQDRAALNRRLAEIGGRVVAVARPQIAAYVADVIEGWEPEELNARFEEEIGPDLQFIRINEALLGALIGGALYAVEVLLA